MKPGGPGGSPLRRLAHAALIIAAASLLLWPALLNGYPLLYPDSISYLGDGPAALRALLHPHAGSPGWMRSVFYSLGTLPLHAAGSPWPIAAMQALAAAWVLWLVLRSVVLRRREVQYLLLIVFLGFCSSLPWFSSYLMPDIFGGLLYLAVALLVFAPQGLSKVERISLTLLAGWSSFAHLTHFLVAVVLCLSLLVVFVFFSRRKEPYIRGLSGMLIVLALACVAQLSLNFLMYRQFSVAPNQPPLLTARLLADGPARKYLLEHCPTERWALCPHLSTLTDDEDDFLWSGSGVLATATPTELEELHREEMPLLRRTLQTHGREQLAVSAHNAWWQMSYIGHDDFDQSSWMQGALPGVLPGSAEFYARTLQVRSALPTRTFTRIQDWTTGTALFLIACACCRPKRFLPQPLLGLTLVVLPALVLNATCTAVLSGLDPRYQGRVIWLLSLLAALIVMRTAESADRTRTWD